MTRNTGRAQCAHTVGPCNKLAGRKNGCPATLVLPPGSVEDRLRWLGTWPQLGPSEAIGWLGLSADASWAAVVTAAYARFPDHWAAGVAYHH